MNRGDTVTIGGKVYMCEHVSEVGRLDLRPISEEERAKLFDRPVDVVHTDRKAPWV